MQDDFNQRLISSAERMIDYNDRLFELFQRLGNESKSRIVWLVAIAGFAIINLHSLSTYRQPSSPMALVPAAWVLTALLATVTHWQFRNRSIAEIQTFITKREFLLAYLANSPQAATMAELNDILTHKKEPLPKQFKAQLRVTGFADKLELATMILFVVSMVVTMFEYVIP